MGADLIQNTFSRRNTFPADGADLGQMGADLHIADELHPVLNVLIPEAVFEFIRIGA